MSIKMYFDTVITIFTNFGQNIITIFSNFGQIQNNAEFYYNFVGIWVETMHIGFIPKGKR